MTFFAPKLRLRCFKACPKGRPCSCRNYVSSQTTKKGGQLSEQIRIMGDFRIVIEAVGGHGQDRDKKTGDVVDFSKGGPNCPEALALKFIELMKEAGMSPEKAYIIHWPIDNYGGQLKNNRSSQIVDDLLTGKRNGSF